MQLVGGLTSETCLTGDIEVWLRNISSFSFGRRLGQDASDGLHLRCGEMDRYSSNIFLEMIDARRP